MNRASENVNILKSDDANTRPLTSKPDLKYAIEELKKNYESFINSNIDLDDIWLLIWDFYKNYGDIVGKRIKIV